MNMDFKECETCAKKPSMSHLCAGCRHNREVIGTFRSAIMEIRNPAAINMRDYWHCMAVHAMLCKLWKLVSDKEGSIE